MIHGVTEEQWFACEDARNLVGSVLHDASPRKLRLFAVACCRCNRRLLLNDEHRHRVDLAERAADGLVPEKELAGAYARANALARALNENARAEHEIRRWAEATAVVNAVRPFTQDWHACSAAGDAVWQIRRAAPRNVDARFLALLRDVFANPYRPVALAPAWLTSDVVALARGIYEDKAFDAMPILADALQDAGCNNDGVLSHCREPGEHVRGCWVVDQILGKS